MNIIEIPCSHPWQDRSTEINEMIRNAPDHCRLHFQPGEYYLRQTLQFSGKKGLIFDAAGCIFTVFSDPAKDEWSGENPNFAEICNCSELMFTGFTLRQEKPSNVGGEILDVQPDHVDVRFFQPLTGEEIFNTGMTFSPDGRPQGNWWMLWQPEGGRRAVIAGEIATTAPAPVNVPHEALGNNCFRISKTTPDRLKPGMHCQIKHWTYGNSAFVFRNTEKLTMEEVTITNWGGFAVTILPRCRDFTFRRFACRVEDRKNQPYSVTVDAIHTTGLGGKLLLDECFFDGVGDDTLNSHTATLKVTAIAGSRMTVIFDKPGALFPARWGAPGDTLIVYDGKTLLDKGEITLISAEKGNLEIQPDPAVQINPGDYVVNRAFIPEIIIRNTTAVNSRSRFCIQAAAKLEICHCYFDMVGFLSPVYISSAFRYWGEGGWVEDVDIHDNEIRMPEDPDANPFRSPAIWIRVNDVNAMTMESIGKTVPQTRYLNIRIRNNIIAGTIEASHCEGLEITGNHFDRPPAEAVTVHPDCRNVRLDF